MDKLRQYQQTLTIKQTSITQDFKVIKQIGRGSSGICYLAQNRSKCQQFRCIKQVKKNSCKGPYPKQAVILDRLCHPNIAKFYGIYESDSSFYLVNEYCQGGDLFDYLEKYGPFSERQAKEIFTQILSALRYCHSMKISHRDIKLENFLVLNKPTNDSTPIIKLIDFDLSFQWQIDMQKEVLAQEGLKIKGTPYYIAPQILKGKYDQRCDIWSIIVLLHILLLGCPPFDGESHKHIFQNIVSQKINYYSENMKNLSMLVKDLFKKTLVTADKRLTLQQIFEHPWMKVEARKMTIRVDFSCFIRFHRFSKLKKIAASYLAAQMAAKQTESLATLFNVLDKNKDGFVSRDELEQGIKQIQAQNNGKQQMLKILRLIMDDQAMIDYTDFMATFITKKSIQAEKNLKKVFSMIDCDGNGVIDENQMRKILMKFGIKKKSLRELDINQETVNIFKRADINKDGLIDFNQFKQVIVNDCQL